MTGEVRSIAADGTDANGDSWPVHARVARALRCRLRPFDTYIGPYIAHKRGRLFISSDDGVRGTVCLWPGGIAPAYCAPIVREYPDLYDSDQALVAARDVLWEARGVMTEGARC